MKSNSIQSSRQMCTLHTMPHVLYECVWTCVICIDMKGSFAPDGQISWFEYGKASERELCMRRKDVQFFLDKLGLSGPAFPIKNSLKNNKIHFVSSISTYNHRQKFQRFFGNYEDFFIKSYELMEFESTTFPLIQGYFRSLRDRFLSQPGEWNCWSGRSHPRIKSVLR